MVSTCNRIPQFCGVLEQKLGEELQEEVQEFCYSCLNFLKNQDQLRFVPTCIAIVVGCVCIYMHISFKVIPHSILLFDY